MRDIKIATNWLKCWAVLGGKGAPGGSEGLDWVACSAISRECWAAGAGAGGLLNGGIGELLEKFKQNGQGEAAESWVNDGPNKEVAPPQLKQAIGADVLAALEQQTGLSQEELAGKALPRIADCHRQVHAGRTSADRLRFRL